MRFRTLIFAAALAAPLAAPLVFPQAAFAQAWKVYAYSDSGFAMQLPGEPAVTKGQFTTSTGVSVPSTTYALRQPDIIYSIVVADFSKTDIADQVAVDDAVKAMGATGEVKVNVQERIDRHFGRELSVLDKDGARSTVSIFFVNHKLYELEGRALPPEPESGSGKAVRFQQSLEFVGLGDQAGRPENRGGFADGGPGGPGFGPRRGGPPPPEAFDACKGKASGDAVQFTTPGGRVAASCVQTPDGLAARPNRFGRGGGGFGGRGGFGGPPNQAAIDACRRKAAGDAVQVTTPRGQVAAACVQTPDGALAARPNQFARNAVPPPEALDACRGKAVGDAVQVTTPRGVVAAACAETPAGLAARPNRPPRGGPLGDGPPGPPPEGPPV